MSSDAQVKRSAIVTGAVRGIGRATARRLATAGYQVVVNYRGNEELANEVVAEIVAAGGIAIALHADVTDADQVGRMIEATINQFGRLDVLVNNAGITRDTLIMRMKDEDWDAVVKTNLKERLPLLQGRGPPDDAPALRPDCEHDLGRRRRGKRGAGELRSGQGRHHRA